MLHGMVYVVLVLLGWYFCVGCAGRFAQYDFMFHCMSGMGNVFVVVFMETVLVRVFDFSEF